MDFSGGHSPGIIQKINVDASRIAKSPSITAWNVPTDRSLKKDVMTGNDI